MKRQGVVITGGIRATIGLILMESPDQHFRNLLAENHNNLQDCLETRYSKSLICRHRPWLIRGFV